MCYFFVKVSICLGLVSFFFFFFLFFVCLTTLSDSISGFIEPYSRMRVMALQPLSGRRLDKDGFKTPYPAPAASTAGPYSIQISRIIVEKGPAVLAAGAIGWNCSASLTLSLSGTALFRIEFIISFCVVTIE